MAQYRGLEFLDFLIVIVRWKRFLIILTVFSLIIGYLTVYFLIPPQYDSTATIVATEDSQMNPLSAIAGGLSDLPLNFLGFGGMTSSAKYDLFTTIIYSRTNLEKMIDKFHLKNDYGIESTEKTIKLLKNLITVEITDELAYGITIRSISPEKSADMTNYLVEKVNKDVIELNVKKESMSMFPLDYLQDMLKTALSTTPVLVKMKSNAPIEVSYGIGPASIKYFLAPRIES